MKTDNNFLPDENEAPPPRSGVFRKRAVRAAAIVAAVLVFLAGCAFCALYFFFPLLLSGPQSPLRITRQPDLSAVLTQEQAGEDARQMTRFLEEVHPAFLQPQTADYRRAKEEYFAAASKPMTVFDFRTATSRFLSSMHDGHTTVYWSDANVLPVSWSWKSGSLTVGKDGVLPENARVTAIGGVPVRKITSVVDGLFPMENEAAHAHLYGKCAAMRSVLTVAGVPAGGSAAVTMTKEDGQSVMRQVFFETSLGSGSGSDDSAYAMGEKKDGAFVVTLALCKTGPQLEAAAAALHLAVTRGTGKVIIDVRGNPGGNSDACEQLLNAMGMQPGEYGGVVRFSGPASQQDGYLRRSGFWSHARKNTAVRNDKIRLYVLTDAGTYSSATMLGVWVQDGRLGKVVGSPSANAPSSYGDILMFQLKNSKIYGSVSHKQWLRPDASQNQTELVPDVQVPEGQDALDVALHKLP